MRQKSNRQPQADLSEEEEAERAMQRALRLLGYRSRTEAEVRQRLTRAGFSEHAISRTLATLYRLNLLDDAEFVRAWVSGRTGRGTSALRRELLGKGVARDLVEEGLQAGLSAERELDSAREVAERALRHRVTSGPEDLLRVRRLLQRRGYSWEIITRVSAEISTHHTADEDWLD
jgi:regulatory protein